MKNKRTFIKKYFHVFLLERQKKLIEKHYEFIKCKIDYINKKLICSGSIKLSDECQLYQFRITYTCGYEPHSVLLEPYNIKPCQEIHMYDDHSLCLSYPPDMKWTAWTEVYKYTIPWVVEWVLYYEIYLRNGGKWEGRESPSHFSEHDRNDIRVNLS